MKKRLPISFLAALLLGAPLALGVVLTPTAAQAAVPTVKKIAMVDLQRIINETAAGKKARKNLESNAAAKQRKLDKKRASLEAEQAKLGSLKGAKLQAAQEKLQRDLYEFQSTGMALQQELAEQEGRLLEKMYKNAQTIISEMAKKDGLDLVLVKDQTTVLYTQKSFDITDAVIKSYNSKHK